MSQLSFFSAEAVPPAVEDLTGLLAAPGQVVLVGTGREQGARLSVVVDHLWRAEALAEMIADAGLRPEISRTDETTPLVRTAVESRLVAIAAEWTRGAVKTVPPQWLPQGAQRLPARPRPSRTRHPFAASVGDDAHRDRSHPHRHQRVPPSLADQWSTPADAPGRDGGGTP